MPVYRVSEPLLADSCLAEDQHADVAPGDALHHAVEVLHGAGNGWCRRLLRARSQLAICVRQQRIRASSVARIDRRPDVGLPAAFGELRFEADDDELEI